MDLSIIIVNRNTCTLLADCIRSVITFTQDLDYEIIVVDNASTDGSVTMLRSDFPGVRVIENDENRGFAAANNQGLDLTIGEFILLLNSDTVVTDNAITRMVDFMRQHPEIGAVGPQLRYPDGRIQPSCRMFPSLATQLFESTGLSRLLPRHRLFGKYRMSGWPHDTIREVDQIMGAALMLRRQVVGQIGKMDEHYFFYFEEVDWCFQVKKHGWQIVFYPGAKIIHIGGQTSQKEWHRTILNRYTGLIRFFSKNYPDWQGVSLRLLIILEMLARILVEITMVIITPAQMKIHWQRLHGYINVISRLKM